MTFPRLIIIYPRKAQRKREEREDTFCVACFAAVGSTGPIVINFTRYLILSSFLRLSTFVEAARTIFTPSQENTAAF